MKSQLTKKDPDAGKDWRQEEKGTTEDGGLDGITDSMDMSVGSQRVRHDWATEQQQTEKRKWSRHYSLWEGAGRADLGEGGVSG